MLVFGRDSEFRARFSKHDDRGYVRLKRDHMLRKDEHFFTYDQLRPEPGSEDHVTITNNAYGWSLNSIPPTFCTGSHITELSRVVSNASQAVAKADLISPERRAYLLERWKYWRSIALAPESHFHSLGRE